jgi:hypothetical protein
MTTVTLPVSPTVGQEYVAVNGVTYIWLGNRWNSTVPIGNGTAAYYIFGGNADTWLTASQVNPGDTPILNGGNSAN